MKRVIIFFLFSIFLVFPSSIQAAVLINEISPSTDTEWIELYNDGDTEINLSGFLLEDGNSSHSDDLPLTGIISSKGFLVFNHSEGWLNNSGDTVKLYNNSSPAAIVDQYTYGNIDSTHSVIRSPNGNENWVITSSITNGSSNPTPTPIPTATPTPTNTPTSTPTLTPTLSPTKSPTPSPSKSPTPKPSPSSTSESTDEPEVLGENTETSFPSPSDEEILVESSTKRKVPVIPIVLISSGLLMLGLAILQLMNARKNSSKT